MRRFVSPSARSAVLALLLCATPPVIAQVAADRPVPSAPSAAARSVPVADSVRPDLARTPRVEAQLVAARTAVEPGEALWLALRLKMILHWHTYWRNPGVSGEPTALDWTLPAGFRAEGIRWPAPMRLPAGPLMNYGYEGEVLLPVRVSVPPNLPAGPVTLAARASWLVCNPEQCIPEDADLALTLGAGPAADTPWAAPIRTVLATPCAGAGDSPCALSFARRPGGASDEPVRALKYAHASDTRCAGAAQRG